MSGSSKVKDVVFCPDCGGVIGASEVTEFGHPCRCFADRPKAATVTPAGESASEPAGGAESASGEDGASDRAGTEKICVLCGKNVSGHRRVRDSRGYLCLDCHRTEVARQKPQGVKCPRCGRVVKPESLTEHDGQRVCHRCLRELRDLGKPGSKRYRKIDDRHFHEKNKTQLLILLGVAVVLGVLMLAGWLSR